VPLREQWEHGNDDVAWHEVERFSRALAHWKQRKRMYDFTDLLEQFTGVMAPELDLLIGDEAQDFTPLQWKVFNTLASRAVDVYVAGDDDQAVYHWAGADVSLLIDAPGEARVLGHSYRLPRAVYDVAASIVQKINKRVPKVWEPRDEAGAVHHVGDVSDLPLESGTWYLLARNRYLLQTFTDELRTRGLLYTTQDGPSVEQETLDAIRCWEALRKGREIPAALCANIYELMTAGVGYERGAKAKLDRVDAALSMADLRAGYGLLADGPWFDALTRIAADDVLYLRACLRHGEKLSASRIHVSTIHGVKGGEKDHVAILPDMSFQTWEGYLKEPDHELRVFYVAVTRARQTLTWIDPQGNRAFSV